MVLRTRLWESIHGGRDQEKEIAVTVEKKKEEMLMEKKKKKEEMLNYSTLSHPAHP